MLHFLVRIKCSAKLNLNITLPEIYKIFYFATSSSSFAIDGDLILHNIESYKIRLLVYQIFDRVVHYILPSSTAKFFSQCLGL